MERCIVGGGGTWALFTMVLDALGAGTRGQEGSSNKGNFQCEDRFPRLMFWNKRFKAAVRTTCEVNLWIYGLLLELKAVSWMVIVVLHQVE